MVHLARLFATTPPGAASPAAALQATTLPEGERNMEAPSSAWTSTSKPKTARLVNSFAVIRCLVANGGCDLLTTCTNTIGGFYCGQCPLGYSGNGSGIGCQDVNECQPTSPCAPNASCINVDLKAANLTRTSCVCDGGDCAFIASPVYPGSGGKYVCQHYGRYTTRNFNAMICDQYTQQLSGSFSIQLSSDIRSMKLACGATVRWLLKNLNGTTVYRSAAMASRTSPSEIAFEYPSCVTNLNCSEVLGCDSTGLCNILPNSCFGTNNSQILTDYAVISAACPANGQMTVVRCASVNGQECFTISGASPFSLNGQYLCKVGGTASCFEYSNTEGDTIIMSATFPPTSNDCTVHAFVFRLVIDCFLGYFLVVVE